MGRQTITSWLKAGYPYLKQGAGLPPWLLQQRSLELAADELGDSGTLKLSRPLKLAGSIEAVYDRMPDSTAFTAQDWQLAVSRWPALPLVKEVVEAYLEVADRVTARLGELKDMIAALVVRRSLAVLLLAPLVPQGRWVTKEIADILGGSAEQPGQLIRSYAGAVIEGDVVTVEQVNQCVMKYDFWAKWAEKLEGQTATMKCRPRLIGVTPPPSGDLMRVLGLMMKEVQDEPGRDHPEHPAS